MRFCKAAFRVCCVLMFVLAPAAWAETALTNQDLLEKSGIAQEIRGLAHAMQAGVDEAFQNSTEIDAKFAAAMHESIPVAYQPEKLLKSLDNGLDALLTPAEKQEILTHYDSPLGQRVSEAEKAAVHAGQAIRDFAAKEKPDDVRLSLYKRMDEAVGLTSVGVAIAMNMSIALQAGILSAADGPDKVDVEVLKAAEEKNRVSLTAATQKEVLDTLAYAYRELSQEDLAAYVAVLESPVGRKFSRGLGQLLADVLAEHAKDLGQLIFTNLQTRKTT